MRKLTLHKPALDDYVDVEKDLNENYRKIEEWANSSGTELDNKFDDGGVSTDYDTAKKMEDKIKFLATQIEKTPIGTILPFASGTIPKDYLLCDGREITKNDYSELYDILPFGGYIDEKVFRGLAKNEVPNMTGPTLNGYTITESSVFSATFPGWKAFDSVISGDNGGWASLTGQKEGWVQIQYPNKRALSSFTIKTRTYAPGSKLEKISVYGVTTTSEDELFTENLSRAFTTNEKREFKVNFNKKTYDKFKIKVSAPNDQYCAIDEIELFTVDITQFPNHKQETTKKYLPDLRGQFLRGIKDGRKLLDWESEDIKKHNHKEPLAYPPESSVTNTLKEYTEVREKKTIFQTLMLDGNVNDNVYGRPIAKETYEGNENRPSNIGVNYIIKAKNGINDNSIPAYIESLLNDLNNLKNNLGANIKDNSISSNKLKTDSDADKIKLANLAEEVINSMSKLTKDSVVREYIADGAVNISKVDHSLYHNEYNVNINKVKGAIVFKLEPVDLTTENIIKITWLSDVKLDVSKFYFNPTNSSGFGGVRFKNQTVIEEICNGIYKYTLNSQLNNNLKLARIEFRNVSSFELVKISGTIYSPSLVIDGKSISFTFENTSEEVFLKEHEKNAVGFETMLKQINEHKISTNDFEATEREVVLGERQDEFIEVISKMDDRNFFKENNILLFNSKFNAGKYVIESYRPGKYKLFIFASNMGGQILNIIDLDLKNNSSVEILVKHSCYIGYYEYNDTTIVASAKNGGDITARLIPVTGNEEIGNVLIVNTTDINSLFTNLYSALSFKLCRISSFEARENTEKLKRTLTIEDISKIHSDVICPEPHLNISTIYNIENLNNILFDDRFKTKNIEHNNNHMKSQSMILFNKFQSIEQFTYRVKFKLTDINTVVGISTSKGGIYGGNLKVNIKEKNVSYGTDEYTIVLNDLITLFSIEDRANLGTQQLTINFEVGNYYLFELTRNDDNIQFSVYDYKNDKLDEIKITNILFHGGLALFVENGGIDVISINHKSALYNGAKAIFMGDSITQGATGESGFISLLRKNIFANSAISSGKGFGKTNDILMMLDSIDCYCRYAKYYFVMIGTNQRNTEEFEKWKTDIVKIYNIIKEKGSTPIIVVPPLNKNDVQFIYQMRDFILEKGWDTIRMDIATSTGDGITFDTSLSTDGTHFNANGNQKMYERALIDLKRIM